ncbi:MAG: polymer-forming cytoskeletal protein [Alphaproteobacteria bacterium]|nr:polymer-forming cytoskeletal protein [Alphaproteobacteria bacterium]
MFSKSKKTEIADKIPASPPPSIVSADMRLIGDLVSQGEVHIDGVVEGDIRAKTLLIGETADIKGEILAEQVRVHGRVTGQIKSRVVHLASTAHVAGDVLHEALSIETGAFIEGNCERMNDRRDNASAAATAAAAPASPAARIAGSGTGEGKKLFGGPSSS